MTRILTTIKPHKEKSMQTTGFGTQFSTISANTAVYDFHLCTLNWYSNHSIVWSQKLANPRQLKCVMHRQHSLCSERQGKKQQGKAIFIKLFFFAKKEENDFHSKSKVPVMPSKQWLYFRIPLTNRFHIDNLFFRSFVRYSLFSCRSVSLEAFTMPLIYTRHMCAMQNIPTTSNEFSAYFHTRSFAWTRAHNIKKRIGRAEMWKLFTYESINK